MLKVAICDDEKRILDRVGNILTDYIKASGETMFVEPYLNSGELMLETEGNHFYDIYVLDVQMPGISGITLAKRIKELAGKSEVIMLTSYEEFAVNAINIDVRRYVMKNRLEEEFLKRFKEVAEIARERLTETYTFTRYNDIFRVTVEEIVYVLKMGKFCEIHKLNGEVLSTRETIQNVFDFLKKDQFVWLDRGCIANIEYILNTANSTAYMKNGEKLQISRSKMVTVKECIANYWRLRI